jgi:hypothetical protein
MDFFLPASSFQNLKGWVHIPAGHLVTGNGKGSSLIFLRNYLNGAAHFLYFFFRTLAALVRFDMEGVREFSGTQNLEPVPKVLNDFPAFENLGSNLRVGFESGQLLQIDCRVFLAEYIGESPFRQPAVQRHLSAFESGTNARAGAGQLSIVSAGRCFPVPGTHAPADTFVLAIRAASGLQSIYAQHFRMPCL